MMYECTNRRCKWKGDQPNMVTPYVDYDPEDAKPYCPVCNYEAQEKVEKSNSFKKYLYNSRRLLILFV